MNPSNRNNFVFVFTTYYCGDAEHGFTSAKSQAKTNCKQGPE